MGAKAFSNSSSDGPRQLLAVDEEGRRRVHAELLGAARAHGGDVIEELLVGQALVEALLGEARLLGHLEELGPRVAAHEGPGLLRVEQRADQRENLVAARAARQHRGARRQVVERELAHDEAHLAGVDVLLLERREHGVVEVGAVAAGHGGVLHDRDGRVVLAEHEVGQRAGLRQLLGRHLGGACLLALGLGRQRHAPGGGEAESGAAGELAAGGGAKDGIAQVGHGRGSSSGSVAAQRLRALLRHFPSR